MEDSNEVHSEKTAKRKLKTPAQLTALESFYDEHKYPTDIMKSQVAEQIGLTDKQVSGWFCHRRLKDKRLLKEPHANKRQDPSSVLIQDRASGLRQDSCGSTKQGDYRYADAREVESQTLYGNDLTTADLGYRRRSQYLENVNAVDNTSSESSSSLQDRFLSQQEDPYDMETSSYLIQNGPLMQVHSKAKNMGYKPSGYLKLKGAVEHAAITEVKMQLGSHFREDGPLLGVEFDLLPPGAFEAPISCPVDELFNIGDSKQHFSPPSSRGRKQYNHGFKYGVHAPKMRCQDSDNVGANGDTLYGSDNEDKKSHCQRKQRSPLLNYSGPYPSQKSPIGIYEDCSRDAAVYDTKKKNRMSSKHNLEGMKLDPGSNPDSLYGGRITTEKMKPWVQESDNLGYNNSIEAEQRTPSRKMANKVKHYGERKAVKTDGRESVRVEKRFERERPRSDYVTKTTYSELPVEANQIKRSAMEIPSSFSEDETAETSSSAE